MITHPSSISDILESIHQEYEAIVTHPVNQLLNSPENVTLFMQYHVFAVWDFMSLLKFLQGKVTCVSVPWIPAGEGELAHLINEIVLAEESDVDTLGKHKSHFEIYLEAMHQCGACTHAIERFLGFLKSGVGVSNALAQADVPLAAKLFVSSTFDVIGTNKLHVVAGVFAFGRERLIPDMFSKIVSELNTIHDGKFSLLLYYLERHIEIDGNEHGIKAFELVNKLCGNNSEMIGEVREAVVGALRSRRQLLNEIHSVIQSS